MRICRGTIIRAFDYDLTDLDAVAEVKQRLGKTIKSFNITERQEESDVPDNAQDATRDERESQLLPVLYAIQDQITQLKDEIHNKDTETIQAIVKASQPITPVEDANTALMKALIPELVKNPSYMKNLLQISEMAKGNGGKR